ADQVHRPAVERGHEGTAEVHAGDGGGRLAVQAGAAERHDPRQVAALGRVAAVEHLDVDRAALVVPFGGAVAEVAREAGQRAPVPAAVDDRTVDDAVGQAGGGDAADQVPVPEHPVPAVE